jgi:4-amino-4-deoxy-L-arabinose transferase-like glycosyltransferase
VTPTDRSETRRALLWLGLLCIPMYFVGLASYDLDLKGEPREGLTAWAAIHQDFLLPVLNGERLPEKPLFFPWLAAAAMQVFGETSEWAMRVPSALAASGLVFVVHGLGRRLISPRGGLVAASATACTFLVVKLARSARVDMTLTLLVCTALLFFLEEFQRFESDPESRPSTWRVLGFWLCLALGTLTKGPLAVILVVLAVLPFLVVRRRLAFVRRLRPWLGVVLLLALPGAWYAHGLLARGREFGFRTFLMENVLMFFGAEGGGGHRHGFLYFVPDYIFFGLPWSVLLPAAVVWAVRRGRGAWRSEPMVLPLGWFAAMFLFFSIASGKRQDYLLPLVPAAALLVAGAAESAAVRGDETARRWLARSSWTLALVGAASLLVLAAGLWAPSLVPAEIAAREGTQRLLDAVTRHGPAPFVVLSAVLVAAFAVPVGFSRRRGTTGVLVAAGALSIGVAVASTVLGPEVVADETYRPFAAQIRGLVAPQATIRRYGEFEPQLLFYLNREVPAIATSAQLDAFLDEPGEAWVICDRATYEKLGAPKRTRLEVVADSAHSASDASLLLKRVPPGR